MGCGLGVSNDETMERQGDDFSVLMCNDTLGWGKKMVVASRSEVEWNNYVGRKYRRPRRWHIRGTISVVMVNDMNQGFQVLLNILPLGARRQSYVHTVHSL